MGTNNASDHRVEPVIRVLRGIRELGAYDDAEMALVARGILEAIDAVSRVGRPAHPKKAEIIEAVRVGATRAAAARRFKANVATVYRYCKEAGLPPGQPGNPNLRK
jgi:hypothetical protein